MSKEANVKAGNDKGGPAPKTRVDQIQCPRCGGFGCPASGGTYPTPVGITRYRVCTNDKCKHRFVTTERPSQPGAESITG